MKSRAHELAEICERLGIPFDREHFYALERRTTSRPSVAVLGLVSRGKSTLVNELVGLELCPVSHKGETAAVVEISNGKQSAVGADESGAEFPIQGGIQGFTQRIARTSLPLVRQARFQAPCRLPADVVVVDTPGIDDAAGVNQQLEYLQRHWITSGAAGALAVISVPPGFGRSDREFLEEAQRLFKDKLGVVVKGTDSSVIREDLEQVAEAIEDHVGIHPIVLDPRAEIGPWGSGKTEEIDRLISRFINAGAQSKVDAAAELSDQIELIRQSIERLGEDRLVYLDQVRTKASGIDERLGSAVSNRVSVLRDAIAERQRIEEAEKVLKKRAALDSQARELVALLPQRLASFDDRAHGPTLRELVKLAEDGSTLALSKLQGLLAIGLERRDRLRISLVKLIGVVSAADFVQHLGHTQLTFDELAAVVETATDGTSDTYFNSPMVKGLLSQQSQHTLTQLHARAKCEQAKSSLHGLRLQAAVNECDVAISRCENAGAVAAVVDSLSIMKKLADEKAPKLFDHEKLVKLRSQIPGIEKRSIDAVIKGFRKEEWNLRQQPTTVTLDGMQSRVRSLSKQLAWLDKSREPGVAQIISAFGANGTLVKWAEHCVSEQSQAQNRARKQQQTNKTLYALSFVGWIISIIMLIQGAQGGEYGEDSGPLQGTAFVVWLISFCVWLATRNSKDVLKPWAAVFRTPTYPPKVASEVHLELTKQEQSQQQDHPRKGRTSSRRKATSVIVGALLLIALATPLSLVSLRSGDQSIATSTFTTPSTSDVVLPGRVVSGLRLVEDSYSRTDALLNGGVGGSVVVWSVSLTSATGRFAADSYSARLCPYAAEPDSLMCIPSVARGGGSTTRLSVSFWFSVPPAAPEGDWRGVLLFPATGVWSIESATYVSIKKSG